MYDYYTRFNPSENRAAMRVLWIRGDSGGDSGRMRSIAPGHARAAATRDFELQSTASLQSALVNVNVSEVA